MRFKKKHVPRRKDDGAVLEPGKTMQQTVVRNGERVTIVQRMDSVGKVKTIVNKAHTKEDDLQTEQVIELKKHPEYGKRFTFAGDMNAAKRGPVAAALAKKTGMMAGEPDLRIYVEGDDGMPVLVMIENKNAGNYTSGEQRDRHELLSRLGFPVWNIKTDSVVEAARAAIGILEIYLNGERRDGWHIATVDGIAYLADGNVLQRHAKYVQNEAEKAIANRQKVVLYEG